jgi:translation initiation factor IF-1
VFTTYWICLQQIRALHNKGKSVSSSAPIDLLPLPPSEITYFDASQWAEFILKMHETTKLNIEKMNEKYRIAGSNGRKEVKLEPGDLVWLHLRK